MKLAKNEFIRQGA